MDILIGNDSECKDSKKKKKKKKKKLRWQWNVRND